MPNCLSNLFFCRCKSDTDSTDDADDPPITNQPLTPASPYVTPASVGPGHGHKKLRKGLKAAGAITTILDNLSGPFPFLQPIVGPLQKIVDIASQYLDNDEDLETLQEYITRIERDLQRLKRSGKAEYQDQSLTDLKRTLQHISDGIVEMNSSNVVTKALSTSGIAEKIKGYLHDAEQALNRYHGCLIQEIRDIVQDTREYQLLNQLLANTSQNAAYNPDIPGCLLGTRAVILGELKRWASDQSMSQVYWLNGYAGTGKTAIAQSFAKSLSSPGSPPVASFFFSRESLDKSDIERILPTLSYQLSTVSAAFKEKLVQSIANNRSISIFTSLTLQLEHLLINPAKESELQTVILIDGLDECQNKEKMLDFLARIVVKLREVPKVKLFIASHRDRDIETQLIPINLVSLGSSGKVTQLETVDNIEDDIRLFIKDGLTITSRRRPGIRIPQDWPPSEQVNTLIEKTAGLFIFASTAVKYVTNRRNDPVRRLTRLTYALQNGPVHGNDPSAEHDHFYEKLDMLYLKICSTFHGSVDALRSVLGVLAVACEPLPRKAIVDILGPGFTDNTVILVLHSLHPFLRIPDDEQAPVGFYHKSFLDFLIDPQRCTDEHFRIDLDASHLKVAGYCLTLMHSGYTQKAKNVCDIPRYSRNNKLFIDDLHSRVGMMTKYGCRYWADHLVAINNLVQRIDDTASLSKSLLSFLQHGQLWWLEVLGLLQELPRATKALTNVHKKLSSLDQGSAAEHKDLIRGIDEGQHFVTFAFEAIQCSVAHIYHSALPFLPSDSIYYRQTADALTGSTEPKVIIGADKFWTDTLSSETPTSHIVFAHFSLDGKRIISRAEQGTTRIWDTTNGTWSEISCEHSSKFCDGTFLQNDNYVICYTDGGVLVLWDRAHARFCDKDTAACTGYGRVHQIFPSNHNPLGFFTAHMSDDTEHKWSISYWDIVQDIGESAGDLKPSRSVCLRLLAHGAIALRGGYGIARINHEVSPNDAQSTTVTVEIKSGRWKYVATVVNPSTTISNSTTIPLFLSFTQSTKSEKGMPIQDRLYVGLERPCLLSDGNAWVLDELNREVLWVPPLNRGPGRWWGRKKLLLEGGSGRLTLVDFSHVDLDSNDLF